MHTVGTYEGDVKTLEGQTLITFCVTSKSAIESLKSMSGQKVTIDVEKQSAKRSLSANAYAWVLFEKLAQALGTDKDSIYKLELKRYGVFEDLLIPKAAYTTLAKSFSYIEVFKDGYEACDDDMLNVRVYMGSSKYNSKEMARLIEGTLSDCKDAGIETWSAEEIERLVSRWQA